jgi:hypothetical protein
LSDYVRTWNFFSAWRCKSSQRKLHALLKEFLVLE